MAIMDLVINLAIISAMRILIAIIPLKLTLTVVVIHGTTTNLSVDVVALGKYKLYV